MPRRDRTVRATAVLGCVAAVAIAAWTTLSILHLRDRELSNSSRSIAVLDTVLAEQTARALQNVNLVTQIVSDNLQASSLDTPADLVQAASGRGVYEQLVQHVAGLPQLDAVTIIGADGKLLNFSRYYPTPDVSLADRDYFIAMRDDPTLRTLVSVPMENRGNGTLTIYLARRISAPNGAFLGLVLGAMNVSYFEHFYADLGLPPGSGVTLWRQDGTLLARWPRVSEDAFKSARPPPNIQRRLPHERWSGIGQDPVTNTPVIFSSTRLQEQPLVVSVYVTEQSALHDWYTDASFIAAVGLLCVLGALGLTAILIRRFRAQRVLLDALAAREQAERNLRAAEAQLAEAHRMEAIGRLTGGVAHDFNNLLTAILGSLSLIERPLAGNERALRMLELARQAVHRGARLSHSLLAFARRQPLRPVPLNANQLLQDFSLLMRRALGESVELTLDLAPDLPLCLADPAQLETAALNLAINARDAMPNGGSLVIRTSASALTPAMLGDNNEARPGPYVAIAVIDSGLGMAPEVLARAFEPFYTTKEVGKGTGLGLSQVFGVVRQLGGHLTMESRLGQGTTATMYLPLAPVETPEEAPHGLSSAAASAGNAPAQTPGQHATVLLVEDEDPLRFATAQMLQEAGWTVLTAHNAESALDLLSTEKHVDVLFSDMVMPGGMSGLDLAREARRRDPCLPVLLATGYARMMVNAPSEFEILPKPYEGPQLSAKLTALLQPARRAPSAS